MSTPREPHATPSADVLDEDNTGGAAWLAGESQAVENYDFDGLDDILVCNEILDTSSVLNGTGLNCTSSNGLACDTNVLAGPGHDNLPYGISDLENLELDTPPDFQLSVSFFITYTLHITHLVFSTTVLIYSMILVLFVESAILFSRQYP